MTLFSIFGKKKTTDGTDDVPQEARAATGQSTQPAAPDPAPEPEQVHETTSLSTSHRDLARLTAEKIDAIEQEMTRDFLKAPPPQTVEEPAPAQAAEPAPAPAPAPTPKLSIEPDEDETSPDDPPGAHLFHTTLVRLDNETMIMPRDAMDN